MKIFPHIHLTPVRPNCFAQTITERIQNYGRSWRLESRTGVKCICRKIFPIFFLSLNLLAAQLSNYQRNISIDYDETRWKPVEGKTGAWTQNKGETLLTLERLSTKTKKNEYHPRFSVVSEPLSPTATPADIHKRAISFLESFQFRVSDKNTKRYPGIQTPVLEFTADHQGGYGLTLRQAIIIQGNLIFYLTAAATLEQFDSQKAEIQKVFASFRIGK